MTNFTRQNYSGAIDEEKIKDFLASSWENLEAVEKIQDIKKDIVSRIFNVWKLNSLWIKKSEELYLLALEELEGIDIPNKDNYISTLKKDIENMSKNQTADFLGEKAWYIWGFESFKDLLNKYISSNNKHLRNLLYDRLVSDKEKNGIEKYLKVIKSRAPENTRKRNFFFDESLFNKLLNNNMNSKDIECFYEEDFSWEKNYFSINTLTNYIDTFWVEIWLAEIDMQSIPDDIRKKYFPSINRKVKSSMYKNILQDLRNKQEILMYGFKDYDKIEKSSEDYEGGWLIKWNNISSWFIAEKIIELEFRELAKLSEYNISIIRWSVWEDQQDKIDLYIVLEDKKTWIKIQDELQITLREDLSLKKRQIDKRNKILKKNWDLSESQIIEFIMKDLQKQLHVWTYFNRPIWRLWDTLGELEKTTIRDTFKRLVWELEEKKEEIINKNPH